ncbi:Oidioi.mRNA.OKI2018_I69.chr1.g185.t1.cds [Oikopleura dioica]|uniref:receptor protein serine/threonine kinase n=1 Tax=Oikopleura dioica TaxID=34765 RepID=A0ABN7SRA1_OIKDI|nr:Oidioi.mRNA.OKI2018_I69.chr1.g185.t1.cds [Oikopleura dioica]
MNTPLECRCYHNCPNGKVNSTCPALGKCYIHLESISNKEHELRAGCLPPHKSGPIQSTLDGNIPLNASFIDQCHENVDHNDIPNQNLKLLCCDPLKDGTLCNDKLNMTPEAYVKPPMAAEFSMAIVIVISIGATCGILLFGTLFHRFYESRKFKAKAQTGQSGDFNSTESTRLMDTTTGSGRGTSNLARRTIAKDLSVSTQDAIGQGRFGTVFSGSFRFDKVAIKYFFPQCEDSFQNETAIFHKPTINLRDEHIVGFVASDIFHSPQGEIKRIIVMDHIAGGSLRDYLTINAPKIGEEHCLKMCESLVKGVSFLHMEINGQKGKESIAHRDLSNTSVMIKPNGLCCIGDFGRAFARPIREAAEEASKPVFSREPTLLYAPPEHFLTRDPLRGQTFEEMTAADVWSMGLLLWEMTNAVGNLGGYFPAYFLETGIPQNRNFQFMHSLHTQKIIPAEPHFNLLYKMTTQCLTFRWQDRITSYKALKSLQELSSS